MLLLVCSRVPSKNVSQFGPAVWPAIANQIYMSEELYYIDVIFVLTYKFTVFFTPLFSRSDF